MKYHDIFLLLILCIYFFTDLRHMFKISYYERKLCNRDVDISAVKNMAWYKLWINSSRV